MPVLRHRAKRRIFISEKSKRLPPPPPNNEGGKSVSYRAKRFSIKFKLLLIFGVLIILSIFGLGALSLNMAKKAVEEKVETHLEDKASDIAEIIDGRVQAFFQFLEGLARAPILRDKTTSINEKVKYLTKEATFNKSLNAVALIDRQGNFYHATVRNKNVSSAQWFATAVKGERAITDVINSLIDDSLVITFAVPIRDDNKDVIGVLGAVVLAEWLTDAVKDIDVGQTGYAYVVASDGRTLAHKDFTAVKNKLNMIEQGKKDASLASLSSFLQLAVSSEKNDTGTYMYKGRTYIASFAKIGKTGRTVVIQAPENEFMGTIQNLRLSMYGIGVAVLIVALIVVYLVAVKIVKPIKTTVIALESISQGDGDLTVRLPVTGNDEVTDLSLYFNQTIEKIGSAIKAIDSNAHIMEEIGSELASNMTETASSVHEISSNIDSVKQQALTQAASVTETASTIEEIIRTISQLNTSIENQAASVAIVSSSIEEMVANIASITNTLEKSDGLIKELSTATRDGKETLTTSNSVTSKIAEESGSFMEASSVIQHIASQTNLLAMNAAIEAAHAGEAGKGFAVVADEIRKLAEESASQGKTITATLKTLSAEIEGLSSSSKIVETKFNAIFNLAEQVKDMSHRLTEAMKEQENGSREVLTAIKDINQVTSEVQEGSNEMLKGSEGVAKEMEKLDGLTRVITDSMNEMAAGAVQISNAVQEVADISNKNKASINELVNEVSRFSF